MSALIFTRLPVCPYKDICATDNSTDLNSDTSLLFSRTHFQGPSALSTEAGARLPCTAVSFHQCKHSHPLLKPHSQGEQRGWTRGRIMVFSFLPKMRCVWLTRSVIVFRREAVKHFIDVSTKRASIFIEILLNFNNLANLKSPLCWWTPRTWTKLREFKSLWRQPGARSG